MGGNLHDPLDRLVPVVTGPVQGGEPVVPHAEETLARVVNTNKLSSHLLVVRVVHHETGVTTLVLLVNIVKNKFLLNHLNKIIL